MRTDELDFKPRKDGLNGTSAVVEFRNGYGASVITGEMFCTSADKPYEVAVLKGGSLTYETPITDDVLGYQDAADVERVLAEIEALPSLNVEVYHGVERGARNGIDTTDWMGVSTIGGRHLQQQ